MRKQLEGDFIRERDDMPRVQIKNKNDDWLGTEYWIDEKKVEHVKSVDFRVAVDEVPTFKFETCGRPDIDMLGRVTFAFSPENLSDACLIVSEELKKRGDFYKAFVDSILSVIKPKSRYIGDGETEIIAEFGENYLAEEIVRRIAGEE